MTKIETALGLMYSMICGGESHSATSIVAYDEAKEELIELRTRIDDLIHLRDVLLITSGQLRAEVEKWKQKYNDLNELIEGNRKHEPWEHSYPWVAKEDAQ